MLSVELFEPVAPAIEYIASPSGLAWVKSIIPELRERIGADDVVISILLNFVVPSGINTLNSIIENT